MKATHYAIIAVVLVLAGIAGYFAFFRKKEQTDVPEIPNQPKRTAGNPDVMELQRKLNEALPADYPKLVVDGIWGPKTQAAILELAKTNKLPNDLYDKLKDLEQATTLTDAQASEIANGLFSAMNGATNWANVYKFLAMVKTTADWQAVRNAFGKRQSTYTSFIGDLVDWLKDETANESYAKQRVNQLAANFGTTIV